MKEQKHYLSRLASLTKEIEAAHPAFIKVPEKLTNADAITFCFTISPKIWGLS